MVVLLHGIVKNPSDVWLAARYLRKRGYRTLTPRYSVRDGGIRAMAERVWSHALKSGAEDAHKIHFIGHSLGGLVAHEIIRAYNPPHLGRVVMWGTPLQGCEYADRMNGSGLLGPLYRLVYGKAGQELMIACENPDRFKPIGYEAGMIAGTRSLNPFSPYFLKGASPHDGVVPVARTKREGLADHIVLNIDHTFMPFSPRVWRQAGHFLAHGRFLR